MSNLETLQPGWENKEFSSQYQERFFGFEERDERIIAATAVLGPLATIFAMQERTPHYAAPSIVEAATSPDATHSSVEFLPTYEAVTPNWRDGAREHIASAAVMFAERNIADYRQEDFVLAA